MQLKQPVSPVTTKFKVMPSAGKVMPTLKAYCFSIRTAMQTLRDSIHKKGPWLLRRGQLLLYGNDKSHAPRVSGDNSGADMETS